MSELLGRQVDEFRLLAPLGSGGMADVFVAKDTRLDRAVAFKLVKQSLREDNRAQENLRREARLAARVSHPHVASIFRSGEFEYQSYYVMELLTGGSMQEIVEHKSSFTMHQYFALFAQACSALQGSVSAGVIHRDVKPGNFLLDPTGRLKLTDFGLARAQGEEVQHATWLAGTPLYIAPEIIQGEQGDALSDMYSLGATFFHLFAGQPPYVSDGKPFGVIEQHRHSPVPNLKDVSKKAPNALRDLLKQMMSKDPQERPQSFSWVGSRIHEMALGLRTARLEERMRWCNVDQVMTPAAGDRCLLCKNRYTSSVTARQLFDVDIVAWRSPAAPLRVAEYMSTAVGQRTEVVAQQMERLPFRLGDRVTAEMAGRLRKIFVSLGAQLHVSAAGKEHVDQPLGSRQLQLNPIWPPSSWLAAPGRPSFLRFGS